MFELVGVRNGDHLNRCHGNSDRLLPGLRRRYYNKEAAEWKISPQECVNGFEKLVSEDFTSPAHIWQQYSILGLI